MGIKEKLPLINSQNKAVRIAGYVIYAIVALVVLGALSGGDKSTPAATTSNDSVKEESCVDAARFSIQTEDILMQTGYFKKVYANVFENEFKLEVEPSTLAYSDPAMFKPLLYATVERAPACLDIKDVQITAKLADYNMVLRYPFSAAVNHTEDQDGTSQIEQR
jgi:hypothetical protein